MEKKSKETRINEKINDLKKTFENLSNDTQMIIYPMIEKLAFMSETLDDLQDEINLNGITETYKNGENQYGIKKSASVDVYNTMIKNYSSLMKQLTDLLPKDEFINKPVNPLIAFMDE